MLLVRLLGKIVRGEKITRADVFDAPTESILSEGRLILAALSLFAVLVSPDLLAPPGTAAFGVLVAYTGFAVAVVAMRVWRFPGRTAGYAVHVFDIAFLFALSALTGWRFGPFYPFFIFFILFAASLRWNWQAVMITAAVIALAVWGTAAARVDDEASQRMALIRCVYVILTAAMLAYAGAARRRRRGQISSLTEWPGPDPAQMHSPSLANMLAHCASVMESPRLLVVWEELEEPFVNVVVWQTGEYKHTRHKTNVFGNLVRSREYAASEFWTDDAASTFAVMPGGPGPVRLQAPIIDDALIKAFGIRSVATAPLVGSLCSGRVFVLDRESWSNFQLHLTQIIASRIANALDHQIIQRQSKEAAAERERARLTRDLHDGLLQSLTAAGLQIKLLANSENAATRERLDVVRQLLNGEQRRIRDFVCKPPPLAELQTDVALGTSLRELLAEMARHWDCATSLTVEPPEATVPTALCAHLSLMLAEAVANAVRHGQASSVRVSIRRTPQDITVHVRDDGHGFDGATFMLNDKDLPETGLGPISLRDRVRELGGLLGVKSSPAGVDLQIQLPLT